MEDASDGAGDMDSLPSMLSVEPTQDVQRSLYSLPVPMPEKQGKTAAVARQTVRGPVREQNLVSRGQAAPRRKPDPLRIAHGLLRSQSVDRADACPRIWT